MEMPLPAPKRPTAATPAALPLPEAEGLTIPAVTRQRVVLSLHVDEHRCLSCGGCISVCPRMVVPVSRFDSLAEGILCRGCGLCVQVCPVEALSQIPVALADPPQVPDSAERRHAARLGSPTPDETH